RQRLSLRHGDDGLRAACALARHRRSRSRHDSRRPCGGHLEQKTREGSGVNGVNASETSDLVPVSSRATSALIKDAFVAAGLPAADAARCAELMTEADLTGADGHGIFRLPQYIRRLAAHGFNKRPNMTISRTAPATPL